MFQRRISLREHLEVLKAADDRFYGERDRRYTEVNAEREKALKIKDTADIKALELAREIQSYKDEKANELREQISSERGLYATKADINRLREYFDALHRPVVEFMAAAQSVKTEKRLDVAQYLQILALIAVAVGVVIAIVKK